MTVLEEQALFSVSHLQMLVVTTLPILQMFGKKDGFG